MKRFALLTAAFFFIITSAYTQETEKPWINTFKERIKLSGYAQLGYTFDDDQEGAENTFDIKRLIFMADGYITDKWSAHFIYNFYGATMFELYTDYRIIPGLAVRFGQFKVPLTMEGPLSPSSVELIECYSQATNYFTALGGSHDPLRGGTGGRDMGLMLYGDIFKDKLTYHLGVLNGQGINTRDRNNNKDFIGSLVFTPINWLKVGGTVMSGKGHAVGLSAANPDIELGDNYRRDRWTVGTMVETKPVSFRTEYMAGKDAKVKSDGYYAMASFHVLPRFDIIASYDYLNRNKDLSMKQTNYIAGVQYWFYPRCRLQAQYTLRDRHDQGTSNLFQAQLQVRF